MCALVFERIGTSELPVMHVGLDLHVAAASQRVFTQMFNQISDTHVLMF